MKKVFFKKKSVRSRFSILFQNFSSFLTRGWNPSLASLCASVSACWSVCASGSREYRLWVGFYEGLCDHRVHRLWRDLGKAEMFLFDSPSRGNLSNPGQLIKSIKLEVLLQEPWKCEWSICLTLRAVHPIWSHYAGLTSPVPTAGERGPEEQQRCSSSSHSISFSLYLGPSPGINAQWIQRVE